MYEPHLEHRPGDHSSAEGSSLLEELDKLAPLKSFDAFPKVQSAYNVQSRRGGVLTAIVGTIIFLLVLNDLGEYLYGAPDYSFRVDNGFERNLQLNVDMTVAMPCRYLSIDLRDEHLRDRSHLSNEFAKEGTVFDAGSAKPAKMASASEIIRSARRTTPNQKGSLAGLRALFSRSPAVRHSAYRPTHNLVDDGPACRIYGSVNVNNIAANLHITTLGHGYMSFEHTDHKLMNLSHVIHEFSFGPFFPAIAQPLDLSLETTDEPFAEYLYFIRVVPTTYIDSSGRRLVTSQYAVTENTRAFDHGRGVPGIFFKYDLEPMSVTIHQRTTTLYQFWIRLVGVIGGVWTVAAFALRVVNRAQKEVVKATGMEKELIPSAMSHESSPGLGESPGVLARANSWMSSQPGSGLGGSEWKRR